jgi:hypothetical protein
MKKISTLFCLILFMTCLSGQLLHAQGAAIDETNNPNHFRNPLWVGFNMGGAWQTSSTPVDHVGFGGGITVSKNYLTYTDSKLFVGWRFRYLGASTYGQDYRRNTGIKNNQALNGTADTTINYVKNGGFVYNNYQMTLNELSLEIVVGPNLIHKKSGSGPLVYLFGGVGFVQTQTLLDMKDANGVAYDFKGIDTAGTMSKTQILNALSAKQDHTYETAADGNTNPTWHFMPSLGIGLGYQFKNVVQLGVEYKMTFAGATPIDGVAWNNDNSPFSPNNKYNYLGAYLKFGFGGHHHTNSGSTSSTITPNTYVNNTPPPPPAGVRPSIYITYPSANPYAVNRPEAQLTAHLQYVPYAGDIQVTVNGTPVNSWHYNAADGVLNGDFALNEGNNVVNLTATNGYGTESKSQYFEYTVVHVNPIEPPPVITITSPVQNPFSTSSNMIAVTAILANVNYPSEIQLKVNGTGTSNFQFDPASHLMQFTAALGSGNNFLYITAANTGGTDSRGLNITYTPVYYSSVPAPVVQFTAPGNTPFLTQTANGDVSAMVQNVTNPGEIQFMVNGQRHTDFNFDPNSGVLSYSTALSQGNNYFYIRATNETGTDSKSMDIVYTAPAEPAPVVSIYVPYNNPLVTASPSVFVRARVDNINFPNQIAVNMNGMAISSFTYSVSSRMLEFSAPLAGGNNSFTITATNSGGNDSKTGTVIYSAPSIPRPVVTILSPIGTPYAAGSSDISVSASVSNITSSSQIAVAVNGNSISGFNYNPYSRNLQFTAALAQGDNAIVITATNNGGYDSKSIDAVFTPVVVALPVVTITSPGQSPFTSASMMMQVKATVLNITSQNQIQVIVNGVSRPNFSFSLATHSILFNALLRGGTNMVNILAANDAGSDNKDVQINFVPGGGVPGVPRPVVTFTQPANSPATSTFNTVDVYATVTNVGSRNDIHLQVNGGNSSNFVYDASSGKVTFTSPLNPDNNYFLLTASNPTGADTKTLDVIYVSPPVPKPVIVVNSPTTNPYTTALSTVSVSALIENVTSVSQVQLLLNGVSTSSYQFNPGNGMFSFSAPLNTGMNTFTITATTPSGSATATQQVKYSPIVVGPRPVVTITTPALMGTITHSLPFQVNATIQNVTSASGIQVMINGNSFMGFSFNPVNQALSFTTNLQNGHNDISVRGTNANGTDIKSIVVEYTPLPPVPKPVVTITSPLTDPMTTINFNAGVTATVINVSGNVGINVTRNSAIVSFVFDPNSHVLTINDGLLIGMNTFVITATNQSGSDTKTVTMILSHNSISTSGGGGSDIRINHDGGGSTPGSATMNVMSPIGSPASVTVANPQVTIAVTGAVSSGDFSVKVNGTPFTTGVSYIPPTHTLLFKPNLVPGSNTIEVKISNASGTVVKTLNVQYYAPGVMHH